MKRYFKIFALISALTFVGTAGVIAGGRVTRNSNTPNAQKDSAKQSQTQDARHVVAQSAQTLEIPNDQIDAQAFLTTALESTKLRESRRITEDEFIRLSREKGVVVLDARSRNRYDQLHIKGAISLPFTDMTVDHLAEQLPDKNVKILIYCNNNFRGNVPEFQAKMAGAALNLSTYASLYEYGYRNVYELGPALDLDKTKLQLVGTSKK
jgi:phage shock protein E